MSKVENVKSILIALYEEGDDTPSSALGYGLSLAQAADAHANLQAGSVKLDVPSSRGSAVLADYVIAENQRVRRLAERMAQNARGDGAMSGIVCETSQPQTTYKHLRDQTLAKVRVSDVAVMEAAPEVSTVRGDLLRTLLFESGRPVIVVPEGVEAFSCERIVVAWDGSQAASRAALAALPFLRAASSIEIACVQDASDTQTSAAGSDLAGALARHGVSVVVKELNRGATTAETLRDQVSLFKADLLVMGAFVHSPVREWLFGGVTKVMLKAPPCPLLMAH